MALPEIFKTQVITVDAAHPDAGAIEEAASIIRRGRLVAFPTETVYGLGANARDSMAVSTIFVAKQRPSSNPLIVHTSCLRFSCIRTLLSVTRMFRSSGF